MTEYAPPPHTAQFLRIAIQGKRRGCSGGEDAARKLAKAMIEYAGRLDHTALLGAAHFLSLAAASPTTARMLIAEL